MLAGIDKCRSVQRYLFSGANILSMRLALSTGHRLDLLQRVIHRTARLGKPFGSRCGDVGVILEAYAELAVAADHRFDGKAHAWRERQVVALDDIRVFMDVEADAVAGAVRQPGYLVAGSEPGRLDDRARGASLSSDSLARCRSMRAMRRLGAAPAASPARAARGRRSRASRRDRRRRETRAC